jgi:peptidoglycan/xylan/chitin deacetylase (PgdA/CDA1 family)
MTQTASTSMFRRCVLGAGLFWLCLLAVGAGHAQAAPTVVSLTFDDGRAAAYPARSILASHGMRGTFYLNSAYVGSDSYYMTWAQIDGLAADGNEIGGHTLHHTNLTSVSAAQAKTEVCDDRAALNARGHSATSFAYPEIAYNATVQQIVRDCGYTSARGGDDRYPPAESLPPADPFGIRTVPAIETKTTLANMQQYVTNVENSGGGWVVFMFHSVCSNCGTTLATSEANLKALLDWLQPRSANGTTVRTVGEVTGADSGPDTTPPTSSMACNGGSCSAGWYTSSPVQVSLSASDFSSGVADIRYTTDGSDPTTNGTTYTAPFTVSGTSTVRWYATDKAGNSEAPRSTTVRLDTLAPTVSLTAPAAGATLARGSVPLTADATDAGSGVARVEFRADNTVVGTDTAAPYGVTWNAKRKGSYTLTAKAFDAGGLNATSTTRTVTIR